MSLPWIPQEDIQGEQTRSSSQPSHAKLVSDPGIQLACRNNNITVQFISPDFLDPPPLNESLTKERGSSECSVCESCVRGFCTLDVGFSTNDGFSSINKA